MARSRISSKMMNASSSGSGRNASPYRKCLPLLHHPQLFPGLRLETAEIEAVPHRQEGDTGKVFELLDRGARAVPDIAGAFSLGAVFFVGGEDQLVLESDRLTAEARDPAPP